MSFMSNKILLNFFDRYKNGAMYEVEETVNTVFYACEISLETRNQNKHQCYS